jgi:N-methylhydantoinase B
MHRPPRRRRAHHHAAPGGSFSEQLAHSIRPAVRSVSVDPVTAEVIRGAMETIAFEMATHVSLTATTPILNQSNERNASILDATGRLAAISVGVPQLMLTSTLPVRFALRFYGAAGLHDGDVLLANDPYHGGGHLPDYNVFAPVFHDGELVLFVSIQCHQADTGGGMPGGYNVDALDVWAEGVRVPVLKLVERGEPRRDALYLLETNNRTPTFPGDLRAQIGSAQLGVRRLKEVVARHGGAAVRGAVDFFIATTARRVREEIARWPDGTYVGDAYVDHDPRDNRDIHVHCALTVRRGALTIDFTGSDTRQNLQAYSTFSNTRGYVMAQLASVLDPSIPKNEGFFDAFTLIVPEGTCLNPLPGKTVAGGIHHPGVEVGEALAKALAQIVPERCCPQIYKMGMPTVIYGTHPRTGKFFVNHSVDTIAAGCGAVRGQDGWGSMNVSFGNLIRATAEVNESIFPERQWARDYVTDSGGPGEWRGGCGTRYVKELTAPGTLYTYVVGRKYPHPGIAGGKDGAPYELRIRTGGPHEQVVENTAFYVRHEAGEGYDYRYGGGGGWGDPLARDPQKVLEDVLDEYVSIDAARRDYGVVLTGTVEGLDLRVDAGATRRLRAQLRAQRDKGRVARDDAAGGATDRRRGAPDRRAPRGVEHPARGARARADGPRPARPAAPRPGTPGGR